VNQHIVRAVIVALFLTSSAWAEDYTDPSGLSIKVPDGWILVSKEKFRSATGELDGPIKEFITKNKIDLKAIDFMIGRETKDEEFSENLNLVVREGELPVSNEMAAELKTIMSGEYKRIGAEIKSLETSLTKINGQDRMVIDSVMKIPGLPDVLAQKQVFFVGGGKTFIITCTALESTLARYTPQFDAMLKSIKIPSKDAKAMVVGWLTELDPPTLIGGIIGAVVGFVAGLRAIIQRKLKVQPAYSV
jgi:hypothetical protein